MCKIVKLAHNINEHRQAYTMNGNLSISFSLLLEISEREWEIVEQGTERGADIRSQK